ncbi:methanol/ethanol family PQQ-dependent dehydrogenase [Skermanella mucosa]|uniref:methanol/ethanol family PQQ-dependent dehydrogenase n=1 Tax=Skermanella mucosa TaxID=1789672 RepID=UPI00192B6EFC|nr:methanol/ethanol family PQQ-dependent dehydrogenase [Skermanella mucosa]UEM23410.1 methanol/ethanol family PQQ-dependent dehydrogenase [Skermanella mucosa]
MDKRALARGIAAVALMLAPVPVLAAGPLDNYAPVTQERLEKPEDGNWLQYRRTYDSWGYSPLSQVNTGNVKDMVPVWSFSTGVNEGHQSPPVVNNGVMFITTPQAQVIALDAKTGDLLWRYKRELPEDLTQLHPTNRGVALLGDKVYVGTVDAFIVALDAKTGKPVWEQPVEDYQKGYYITMAPLAAKGKVMVGMSGGEFGIRGFLAAFDAETGKPAWKTSTIPGPGEPGNETWAGETWKTGGAPVWITGSYDPATGLSYWGTGNAAPWMADQRAGDNKWANSVVAIDVETGKMKSAHQYHWNEAWDWDEVAAPILVDVQRDGRTYKSLVHAGRNGYLWILERSGDEIKFVDAKPFVRQNVFKSLDPKTGRPTYDETKVPGTGKRADFCPSLWGGKDWPPVAYNPQTRLMYIPANENLCGYLEGKQTEYEPGQLYIGVAISDIGMTVHPDADHIGELQAWNLDTGQKVWTQKFDKSQNWGPVLTTGGGLVFMGGTNDRFFRAFDAKTGDRLWETRTNSGVTGVPVSYEVDGVQYVAVQSGWGVDAQRKQEKLAQLGYATLDVPQGGVVWVYALRK